eukprot:6181555-Pleurochrysis_carterae.AAC.7
MTFPPSCAPVLRLRFGRRFPSSAIKYVSLRGGQEAEIEAEAERRSTEGGSQSHFKLPNCMGENQN